MEWFQYQVSGRQVNDGIHSTSNLIHQYGVDVKHLFDESNQLDHRPSNLMDSEVEI